MSNQAKLSVRTASLLGAAVVGLVLWCARGPAQEPGPPPPFRLDKLEAGGGRSSSVTERWGTLAFALTNLTDSDRKARILASYKGQDAQYGRDVWLPARATLSGWMLVGPAPQQGPPKERELRFLLADRTDEEDRLLLPRGDERIRSRVLRYRKREPFTALLLDEEPPEEESFGRLPRPDSVADEALRLAQVFRYSRTLSRDVQIIPSGPLPPTAVTFDGVDHVLLASNRLSGDLGGLRALRRWLQQGGKVWVMLDQVGPETLALLLGDAFDFQIVDHVRLTRIRLESGSAPEGVEPPPGQEVDRPVEGVRVLLPEGERAPCVVGGWPAWFTRRVGRGKVVLTALGPRAWYRRRRQGRDPPSPYERLPELPMPTEFLEQIAYELQPPPEPPPFQVTAFDSSLAAEIGYSIPSRATLALTFAGFLMAALVLGAVGRRWRPALLPWLGPTAALVAAGVLLVLGEVSRRSVPPTVAVGQIVEAGPVTDEVAVHGRLALYRPRAGPLEAGAARGGLFELDMAGLEGQTRRLVLTDLDAWHWEDLVLPAGVRLGSFRHTARLGEPITAVAHFGPEGIEGRLRAGPFSGSLSDAVLRVPRGRFLAVGLRPGGEFRAGSGDVLPAGQFLTGAVLSDRRQRRQQLYRTLLDTSAKPPTRGQEGRSSLLLWAEPIDLGFTLIPGARRAGDALLVVPLRLEHSAPGTRVTVPGPFVRCRQIRGRSATAVARESHRASDMHLRFQLPAEVLPMEVEQAQFVIRIRAPLRRIVVAGRSGGALVELHRVASPADPIRVALTDPRLLRLDDKGGLHLNLNIGEQLKGGPTQDRDVLEQKWTIEYVELEVSGRTR